MNRTIEGRLWLFQNVSKWTKHLLYKASQGTTLRVGGYLESGQRAIVYVTEGKQQKNNRERKSDTKRLFLSVNGKAWGKRRIKKG